VKQIAHLQLAVPAEVGKFGSLYQAAVPCTKRLDRNGVLQYGAAATATAATATTAGVIAAGTSKGHGTSDGTSDCSVAPPVAYR